MTEETNAPVAEAVPEVAVESAPEKEHHGIKELLELVDGAEALTVLLIQRLKDGVGVDDALAVFDKLKTDAEFKAKMFAAYDNVKAVKDEVKDIDLVEGFTLGKRGMDLVQNIVAAVK